MEKPETIFRRKVQRRLNEIPHSFWESVQQKAICGTPDILGCVNGIFVALELKVGKNKLTPLQEHKLSKIRTAGGIAICLRPTNLEETLISLTKLSEEM